MIKKLFNLIPILIISTSSALVIGCDNPSRQAVQDTFKIINKISNTNFTLPIGTSCNLKNPTTINAIKSNLILNNPKLTQKDLNKMSFSLDKKTPKWQITKQEKIKMSVTIGQFVNPGKTLFLTIQNYEYKEFYSIYNKILKSVEKNNLLIMNPDLSHNINFITSNDPSNKTNEIFKKQIWSAIVNQTNTSIFSESLINIPTNYLNYFYIETGQKIKLPSATLPSPIQHVNVYFMNKPLGFKFKFKISVVIKEIPVKKSINDLQFNILFRKLYINNIKMYSNRSDIYKDSISNNGDPTKVEDAFIKSFLGNDQSTKYKPYFSLEHFGYSNSSQSGSSVFTWFNNYVKNILTKEIKITVVPHSIFYKIRFWTNSTNETSLLFAWPNNKEHTDTVINSLMKINNLEHLNIDYIKNGDLNTLYNGFKNENTNFDSNNLIQWNNYTFESKTYSSTNNKEGNGSENILHLTLNSYKNFNFNVHVVGVTSLTKPDPMINIQYRQSIAFANLLTHKYFESYHINRQIKLSLSQSQTKITNKIFEQITNEIKNLDPLGIIKDKSLSDLLQFKIKDMNNIILSKGNKNTVDIQMFINKRFLNGFSLDINS